MTAPDSGVVEMLGRRWASDARALRERLGIQLQETQLAEKITVLETVELFRSFYRQGPSPAQVIGLVQLEEKRGARVGTLSGGQKQRLALACALVGDPELLFLDEPTTGLDPQARRQLWDLIDDFRKAGRTILLTTHYMEEAEMLCDRVAIMDHGQGDRARHAARAGGVDRRRARRGVLNRQRSWIRRCFRGLPGVRAVKPVGEQMQLQVTELHHAVPAVLEILGQRGLPLTELRTHSATLEDVFVTLTGRHLRDE